MIARTVFAITPRTARTRIRTTVFLGFSRCYSPAVDGPKEIPPETLILKTDPHASPEDRELKFELDFLQNLTVQVRFDLMFERSRQMAEALEANGHRAPPSILKRT